MPRLPNFFIVGAPKTGTTSLYHYLDQHPEVFMSSIKEPHYFASEIREEHVEPRRRRTIAREGRDAQAFLAGPMDRKRFGGIVADWADYQRLFSHASHQTAIGEASVCYLWSPTAPANIAAALPRSKIVILLRDPADRAFAQYLHGRSNGAIRGAFREHIQSSLRHSHGLSAFHPFLEFGDYAEQIRRYRAHFGRNVWIGFHEDFESRPLDLMQDLFRFLDIDAAFQPDMSHRHLEMQVPRTAAIGALKASPLWSALARWTPAPLRHPIRRATHYASPPALDPQDRQFLIDHYRPGIQQLAADLNRDLSHWLRC